jgi:hypothetical protein
MLTPFVTKYLQTRAIQGPWRISGRPGNGFAGAVVVPALAEYKNLFVTLQTLAANPPAILARILVLVVVNHPENARDEDKEDNRRTLERLSAGGPGLSTLNLAWVDASSRGLEMPAKGGGVGLARKIGLDLALSRLDYSGRRPFLVSLDADTQVEPAYLPAIAAHFNNSECGGAVIPFCHRAGNSTAEQEAIDRYELFLRSYVLGLSLAGSPYAFHTVGSAMACTADAYIRMGGMNRRAAAEDFYFLQQLHRTSGVEQVRGTTVYPSPRPSHRVPFGTGRSVSRTLRGEANAISFYHPECFRILGEWLKGVANGLSKGGRDLMTEAASVSPHLLEYLELSGFPLSWSRLRRNNGSDEALLKAFHGWFDALRTLKLIHHLSERSHPRCGSKEAVAPLLKWGGLPIPAGKTAKLAILREIQNGAR